MTGWALILAVAHHLGLGVVTSIGGVSLPVAVPYEAEGLVRFGAVAADHSAAEIARRKEST